MSKVSGGGTIPEWQRSRSLKGAVYFSDQPTGPVARKWPRKRGKPKSPITLAQNSLFADTNRAIPYVDPMFHAAARDTAKGTAYTYRDILFMCMHAEYIEVVLLEPPPT